MGIAALKTKFDKLYIQTSPVVVPTYIKDPSASIKLSSFILFGELDLNFQEFVY